MNNKKCFKATLCLFIVFVLVINFCQAQKDEHYDAKIYSIDKPFWPAPVNRGDNPIIVKVHNADPIGSTIINSVDIYYQVDNGFTYGPFVWTGTLPALEYTAPIVLDTFFFTQGNHALKVWTSNPNGQPDWGPENDTLAVNLFVRNSLMGQYTIGPLPSDSFASFNEAIDSLISLGVGDSVTINVASGTYNERIVIPEISGASSHNPIIFQSASGDSADVILSYSHSTFDSNYVIKFYYGSYFTFKNMTLQSNGKARYSRVVDIFYGHNISFLNNRIIGGDSIGLGDWNSTIILDRSWLSHDNIFVNNYFEGGFMAVSSASDEFHPLKKGTVISGNTMRNQSQEAVNLSYQRDFIVEKNSIISDRPADFFRAIYCNYSDSGFLISKNKITFLDTSVNTIGVLVEYCNGIASKPGIISNNFVNTRRWGVDIKYSDYVKAYFNSVNISGDEDLFSAAMLVHGSSNISLMNNIFQNKIKGISIGVSSTTTFISDYNDFFSNGSDFALWNYSGKNDLTEWQVASSQDNHSLSDSINFFSRSNLHTLDTVIYKKGIPVTEVVDDIDGKMRDVSHPNIGASEFSPYSPLSGIYPIDPETIYFPSFKEAIKAMVDRGIDGDVVFEVVPGTYNEQIVIPPIVGVSSVSTITFQSSVGDADSVILTYSSHRQDSNYTVKLNGADYIQFKKMTLRSESNTYGRIVELKNGACNNSFNDNYFIGDTIYTTTGDTNRSLIYSGNRITENDTNNTFENNRFEYGSKGIYFDGSNSRTSGTKVLNNYFINQFTGGIYFQDQNSPLIESNMFTMDTASSLYIAALCSSCYNDLRIEKNIIITSNISSANGIDLINCIGSASHYGVIANNLISIKSLTSASMLHPMGLHFSNDQYQKIYFNTVLIHGNRPFSKSLNLSGGSNHIIMNNNLLSNEANGYVICADTGAISESDFNNFYVSNNDRFALLVSGSSHSIPSLALWKDTTGYDQHSFNVNPKFGDYTYLLCPNDTLADAGIPISDVTEDIHEKERSLSSPSIGATEFSPITVSLGDDTSICCNQSIVLDAGTDFDSYTWNDNSHEQTLTVDSTGVGIGTGTYFVTVIGHYCQASDTVLITFSACMGIDEENKKEIISIWPNPSKEKLNLSFNGIMGLFNLSIYSIEGKLIYKTVIDSGFENNVRTFNVSNYNKGVYILKLTGNKVIYQAKFIIQ